MKNLRYNGNISSMQWQNGASAVKSGYKFSYDGLNRLTSAIYGEGDDMSQNADRFSEKGITYNANGSIYRMKRYGMLNDGSYGLVDDLRIKLDGNQLHHIDDFAAETNYKGSANFADADGSGQEYWFNGNGSLSADANKGIARIDYDNYGCPRKIVFTNGNITEYVYSSTGEKLRTTHKTAIDGITVALNGKDNLKDSDFLSEDKTDYHGSFIYENGKLDKVLYPGGYAIMAEKAVEANAKSRMMLFSMSSSRTGTPVRPFVPVDSDPDPVLPLDPITPGDPVLPLFPEPDDDTAPVGESIYEPINPFSPIRPIEPVQETAESSALYKVLSYNYYTQDHLGNNRTVINEFGDVRQVTNYYPFGGVFSTTAYNRGDDLQPYKYNGKELDRTHGLDWYDYGARNYDAFLPIFTSLDPLCEKYYHISPYAYCGNNPIKFIDPTGMMYGDFYDQNGVLIGSDGINDGKAYVIKTTKTSKDYENEAGNSQEPTAPSAGITASESADTKFFIVINNGNTEAFKANNIAYENSVEIGENNVGRRNMDVVHDMFSGIGDDGKGGNRPNNCMEYGVWYNPDSGVMHRSKGNVYKNGEKNVSVEIDTRPIFHTAHSHPSGTSENGSPLFAQPPSLVDVENMHPASKGKIGIVFGMGTKKMYIYDKDGIKAEMRIPQTWFK